MKILLIFLTIVCNVTSVFCQEQKSANKILAQVNEKLKKIHSVRYDLKREVSYPSENYNNARKWKSYYQFDPENSTVGAKFQIEDADMTEIYNGTEFFVLNKSDHTYELVDQPLKEEFGSKSYFFNSLLTLRTILPSIIMDQNTEKTVVDTLINNHSFEKIKINLGKRTLQNLGEGFVQMDSDYHFLYTILVDSTTFFPMEILQTNDSNKDFIRTTFENIDENPQKRKENSWYYSTYKSQFKEKTKKTNLQTIPVGTQAPNWKLELLDSKKAIHLKDLKGKVVVLDFWIKNCGNCIKNVPHLNQLQEKYKSQAFVLFGINAYDSNEKIREFYKKHQLKYSVLTKGQEVAKMYGVAAFPTTIIIDKSGKVAFVESETSDKNQIESVIKKALLK